jgi:hypothetical protein
MKVVCRDNRRAGYAMILVLGYVSAVTLFAAVFLEALHLGMNEARKADRHRVCVHLADAGVDKAIASLRAQGPAYTGNKDTELGVGRFDVTVKPGEAPDTFAIMSRGYLPDIDPARPVRAEVVVEALVVVDAAGARVLAWEELP